ncbi:MAG TPA: ABC transporter substrate-binding protein [Burkholderiaceae bacterium]|nr:ABC transporter substrate-binding protein [Burkholderiaceae bacterium]
MSPRSANRRRVLVAASTLAAGLAGWPARGLGASVPARIGLLLLGAPGQRDEVDRNLLIGLNELGYAEGRNLLLERRYAHSELARLAGFAQEFVEKKLDAIVTTCTPTTRAAHAATQSIPIVMIAVSDPVASAFVQSLAHPGTNVTGRSSQSNDIVPKMLDLFVQSVPRASPLAVLVNVTNPAQEPLWQHALQVAKALNLELQRIELRSAANVRGEDLPAAFERAVAGRAGGVFVLPDDPMNLLNRARIIALAQQHRLPALYGPSEFPESGGLMSYGESIADSARLSARHVDRLLKGARPDTLPVEQPTRFELVVNLQTARQLGVAIPKDMLVIADRVIE